MKKHISERVELTDQEVVEHIRAYFKESHSHWSWCTDGCGYNQHIKFVEYRNKYWLGEGHQKYKDFKQFALEYADKLEGGGNK